MRTLSLLTSLLILVFCLSSQANLRNYPLNPNLKQTPGSLCSNGGKIKYPEKISVCKRRVSKSKKHKVIEFYEKKLGFEVYAHGRRNFKIDHLIPLCIGGSNKTSNLWPQHKTVYSITDDLEQVICVKVQRGRILQADAVELVLEAKHNLEKAPEIIEMVEAL